MYTHAHRNTHTNTSIPYAPQERTIRELQSITCDHHSISTRSVLIVFIFVFDFVANKTRANERISIYEESEHRLYEYNTHTHTHTYTNTHSMDALSNCFVCRSNAKILKSHTFHSSCFIHSLPSNTLFSLHV